MRRDIYISHSFFVDDMLIMGILKMSSWFHIFNIFAKFGNSSRLLMNLQKSIILDDICDEEIIAYIKLLFGVAFEPLLGGMKYLRFHIKPCSYKVSD